MLNGNSFLSFNSVLITIGVWHMVWSSSIKRGVNIIAYISLTALKQSASGKVFYCHSVYWALCHEDSAQIKWRKATEWFRFQEFNNLGIIVTTVADLIIVANTVSPKS